VALFVSCATQPEPTGPPLNVLFPPEQPFPESRFTTINDIRIHYRTWEPPTEPVAKLLLLHGIGGSTYSFEQVVPLLLDQGFAVAAVDLPGFGWSDPALRFEHTAANRLEIIWTLVDRLDTDQNEFNPVTQWYVIGHQMGGELAVWMATDRPGRIAGLVLVSTVIGKNRPAGRMGGFPPVRWVLRSWLESTLYTEEGVRELLENAYAEPPTQEAVNGYLAPLVRDNADRALPRYVRTVGSEIPDITQVSQPVLLVWGTEDNWRSLEEGEEQAELYPDARLVLIDSAGHVPMDTHPQRFTSVTTDWIRSLQRPAQ
jgi:pimeloyl-ACP methyl ester carboxylesterase